jgi:hypothetical protein
MKKTKELIDINLELFSAIDNIEENVSDLRLHITDYYKKIKKEFTKLLIEEKYELLTKIAENENLDINVLKTTYLKPKELLTLKSESQPKPNNIDSEELLDRIDHNGKIYYFENKEKGIVYDSDYKEVGIFKNRTILLN